MWWQAWRIAACLPAALNPAPCVPLQGEELIGTREDGSAASCVVREVQEPQRQPRSAAAAAAKANGAAAGEDSEATEHDDETEAAGAAAEEEDEEEEEQQPAADPDAIVYVVEWLGEGVAPGGGRASLRRAQLRRAEGSPLAALTAPFLQLWVETVATAEPVAVRRCCW